MQSKDILKEALPLVNRLGWQGSIQDVLKRKSMSLQGASLFAKDDLVKYHYESELLKLRAYKPQNEPGFARLRELFIKRLEGNSDIGPTRLQEAIKLSLTNFPSTPFKCLSEISDELWYLAGDKSVDTRWYTRRGSLLGIYMACESFQARDLSTNFKDTKALANNLLTKFENVEYAESSVTEWLKFNAKSAINLARTFS